MGNTDQKCKLITRCLSYYNLVHLSSAAKKHCKLLKFLISTIIMEQFCTLGPEKQMQMSYEVYFLLFVVPGDQKWLQKSDCYWVF